MGTIAQVGGVRLYDGQVLITPQVLSGNTVMTKDSLIVLAPSGYTATTEASPLTGQRHVVKNTSTTVVTRVIEGNGGNIDGDTRPMVLLPGEYTEIVYDGSAWHCVGGITKFTGGRVIKSWARAAFASSVAENTLVTFTIPANLMNATGSVVFRLHGFYTNSTGGNRSFTVKLKFGGVIVWQQGPYTQGTNTTARDHGPILCRFRNDGALDANDFTFGGTGLGAYGAPTVGTGTVWTGANSNSQVVTGQANAVDQSTASDIAFALTVQMSAAEAALNVTYFEGEAIYEPGV